MIDMTEIAVGDEVHMNETPGRTGFVFRFRRDFIHPPNSRVVVEWPDNQTRVAYLPTELTRTGRNILPEATQPPRPPGEHFRVGDRVWVDMEEEPRVYGRVEAESLPQHIAVNVTLDGDTRPSLFRKQDTHHQEGPRRFRVGDRVRHRHDPEIRGTVTFVNEAAGMIEITNGNPLEDYQDRYVDFEADTEPTGYISFRGAGGQRMVDGPVLSGPALSADEPALMRRDGEEAVRNNRSGPLTPMPLTKTRIAVGKIEHSPELIAVLNAMCLSDPPPEIRLALAVLMGDMESAGPLADLVAESRQVSEGTR